MEKDKIKSMKKSTRILPFASLMLLLGLSSLNHAQEKPSIENYVKEGFKVPKTVNSKDNSLVTIYLLNKKVLDGEIKGEIYIVESGNGNLYYDEFFKEKFEDGREKAYHNKSELDKISFFKESTNEEPGFSTLAISLKTSTGLVRYSIEAVQIAKSKPSLANGKIGFLFKLWII